jgi:hypothetical protein
VSDALNVHRGDAVLHCSPRARLVRTSAGSLVCVSPRGTRFAISPAQPELFSIAACWLGLSAGQLAMFVEPERLS